MLLESEGIAVSFITDVDVTHAWNVIVLDGVEYTIDMTEGDSISRNADGSINETLYETNVMKQFYPDEWKAEQDKNSGFNKLSEEEIRRLLEGS